MIRSMTGYGAAQRNEDGKSYALEIRSVNNRYLKLSLKIPDHVHFAENAIEKAVRARVSRGAVDCTLRVRSERNESAATINLDTLRHYVEQIATVEAPVHVSTTIDLATVALLPGVCDAPEVSVEAKARWLALAERLTGMALEALEKMRRDEGAALHQDLGKSCQTIAARLDQVAGRAPHVVEEYHERLKIRVASLMKAGGFELEQEGLMREVAVFAERCDIGEELARIQSHLQQFRDLCDRGDQVGRTLDFLTQELLREANTIASKSNDAEISRCIVEVKGLIDRLREQVQNVE